MHPTSTAPTPALLLIDGSSYLYRAFHAMPDLRAVPGDPTSTPTGALRGMVNMMQALRKEVPAAYVACVFDAKGPTFRDAIYPDYKAQRAPMPDDLRSQIEPIHEMVRLLGMQVLDVPGVEADDVIGTLAVLAAARGMDVVVSSGDKDLAQLVNERITIIDTMNGKRRDMAGVLEEFGVPANLMLDYQNLVGDTVDNVPGVSKVGPKTAVKWLQEYGSLQAVIDNAASIKGVVGENLRSALDWLPTARQLLTIKTDCDLKAWLPSLPEFSELLCGSEDLSGLHAFYLRFGFKGLASTVAAQLDKAVVKSQATGTDLFGDIAAQAPVSAASALAQGGESAPSLLARVTDYETVLDPAALQRWLALIEAADVVSLDTETTSLDGMRAEIVGISLSVAVGAAAYIPLAHRYPDAPVQLAREEVLALLKPWLEDAGKHKLGQHVKYDRHVFANHGIEVQGYMHDTMLQSYVLEVHQPHSLESLAARHLGRKGLSFEDLCGKGVHQIPFGQVDVERATRYSCEDSEMTLAVHRVLWPQIEAEPGLLDVYRRIEMPTALLLQRIERTGVLIAPAILAAQSQLLGERMVALEREAYELAGQPFNMGSPKQVGEILFDKLGLPVKKKTASGAPSTDEEVLTELAADYPLPARLLEHRSLAKLKGTYTDKLPQMINPATGRVHTHYAQAVAVTGRLASNEPNLQNIPIRTAEGRKVREAFIAPPGHLILSADYSQIELRIMAHISEDAGLLKAFSEGMDVHRATASEVFGIEPAAVTTEQRRYAKTINFGLIYGMGAFGLAQSLGIERSAAAAYIERYFERFAGVKRYMDTTRESARDKGYVETLFGRRVYLPEINGGSGPRKAGAERQAINAPMQGTAADLIKLAMLAVQRVLDEQHRASRIVMQVHDELVLEVPEAELDWARREVPAAMASVAALKVPLLAEVGVGHNWDEAH
jgi:DNA polymerase-1